MALADYITINIYGQPTDVLKINKTSIIDVRVVEGRGAWHVAVEVVPHMRYYLNLDGAPFETRAEAETARDTFVEAIPALGGGDTSAIEAELAAI